MNHRYITRGSYGAVFKLENDNKESLNTIAKVFFNKDDWLNEIKKFNKIELIDPLSKFTPIKILEQEIIPSDYYLKEVFENAGKNWKYNETNWQIIYEDCGRNLYRIKVSLNDLIYSLEPIFKGIIKLKEYNLVHQDIKPTNLVYNPDKKIIKLIDFGLLRTTKNIYNIKDNYTDCNYYYFPPEYNIYNIIIKNDSIDYRLLDLNDNNNFLEFKKKYLIYLEQIFSTKILLDYSLKFTNFINDIITKFIEYTSKENIKEFFDEFVNKIDIYMFGISILEILILNRKINISNIPLDLKDLILKMIEPNPIKRITPEDALIKFLVIKQNIINHHK